MIPLLLCATLLLSSVAQARVTFSYSEVLQASDLVDANQNRAPFKCKNGCKVYTDVHANLLYITKWDEQTQLYKVITNFNNIGGAVDVQPLPDPYKLEAGNDYYIENRGEKNPQFVFYVVDDKSPNTNIPVMIVTDDWGLHLDGGNRMVTILSSKYDAIRYTKFEGPFTDGYPRIYSMGYDAVAELQCAPLYQSRSQASAEQTSISVFSPISTVDYGTDGKHNVIVNWNENGETSHDAKGSTVYMSPGYVGCSYIADQSYSSTRNSLQDSYKFDAVSLDVNAKLHLTTAEDTVFLTVNDDNFGLFGTPTFTKHWDVDNYKIVVTWNRKFANANFALQLDFGLGKTDPTKTTSRPISTTSSSSLSSIFVPMIVAMFFVL